jgi:Tfp pilus assembly PilM family ATPase
MAQDREAVGMEIDDRMVRLVHVRRRLGRVRYRQFLAVELHPNPTEAARIVRTLAENHGLLKTPVTVGLAGKSVVFRSIPMAAEDPRSFRQVAELEAGHFDDLSGDETVYDHALLSFGEQQRQILIAVTRAETAVQAVQIPTQAGLKVLDVIPSPVAWFNVVAESLPSDDPPYVLIRVGPASTEFLVGHRGRLLFLRRLPYGRDALLPDVAASAWVDEIRTTLERYRAQAPASNLLPDQVFVDPADRAFAPLLQRLAVDLALPVIPLAEVARSPWVGERAPFATAAGLALDGVGRARVHLSLLPRYLKEKIVLRLQLKYWALSGLVILVTLGLSALASHRILLQNRLLLDARRSELAYLRQTGELMATYRAQNVVLDQKVKTLLGPMRSAQMLQAVLRAVADAKNPDDWITRIADAKSYVAGSTGLAPAAAETEPAVNTTSPAVDPQDPGEPRSFRQIVVEGYTPWEDFSTVRAMIEALRLHPSVREADLLGDDKIQVDPEEKAHWEELGRRLFAIEITLEAP